MTRLLAIDDRVTQKKNRFTNPGMEKSAGGTNVERWRNLCINPAAAGTGYWSGWGGSGGQAITLSNVAGRRPGSSGVRGTWLAGNPGANGGPLTSTDWGLVAAGKTYSFSGYVQPATTRNIDYGVIWFNNVGGQIAYSFMGQISCSSGQWTRLLCEGLVAPPTAVLAQMWFYTTVTGAAGDWISVCDPVYTETNYSTPYFDGDYADPAFGVEATTSWVGTANLSNSRLLHPPPDYTLIENRIYNPGCVDGVEGYTVGAGVGGTAAVTSITTAPHSGTHCKRATWSVGSSSGGYIISASGASAVPCAAGFVYQASGYVRPDVTRNMNVAINWYTSGGALITTTSGTAVSCPGGAWTRISLQATAPATAALARVGWVTPGAISTGGTVDLDSTMMTYGYTLWPYIDGSMGATVDSDYVCDWAGAANTSYSRARANTIPGAFPYLTHAAVIRTFKWGVNGPAARIIPTTGPGGQVFTWMTVGDGDTGALRNGMRAGGTYTILATLRVPTVQTGTIDAGARRIIAFDSEVGGSGYQFYSSTQSPNVIGTYQHRLTFTVRAGAVEAAIRLMNGTTANNGDVYWDEIMLVEGKYDGPYIDGTQAKAKWLGAAHASQSVGYPLS